MTSDNFKYLSSLIDSPMRPPYIHTRARSLAATMSSSVTSFFMKTFACSMRLTVFFICTKASFLPIPNTLDVVSHPSIACTNRRCSHTSSPNWMCELMFQKRGAFCTLAFCSDMKKMFRAPPSRTYCTSPVGPGEAAISGVYNASARVALLAGLMTHLDSKRAVQYHNVNIKTNTLKMVEINQVSQVNKKSFHMCVRHEHSDWHGMGCSKQNGHCLEICTYQKALNPILQSIKVGGSVFWDMSDEESSKPVLIWNLAHEKDQEGSTYMDQIRRDTIMKQKVRFEPPWPSIHLFPVPICKSQQNFFHSCSPWCYHYTEFLVSLCLSFRKLIHRGGKWCIIANLTCLLVMQFLCWRITFNDFRKLFWFALQTCFFIFGTAFLLFIAYVLIASVFFIVKHSTNFEKAKDKNSRKQMVTDNYVCLYTGGDWFKQYYFVSNSLSSLFSNFIEILKLPDFQILFITRGVLIHVIEILSKHIYMLCSPLLIKVWKRARAVVGSTLGIIYYRNRIMLLKVANPWDISKHVEMNKIIKKKYIKSCDDWKRLQKIIVMSQGLKVFKVSEALERLLLQVFMNHMDESAKSSSNVHYLTSVVPEATLPATVPGEQYLTCSLVILSVQGILRILRYMYISNASSLVIVILFNVHVSLAYSNYDHIYAFNSLTRLKCTDYQLVKIFENKTANASTEEILNRHICEYPTYLSHMVTLTMITISSLHHISHIIKLIALLVLVTAQCLLNQFSLRVSLDVFDLIMYDNRIRLAKKGIGEERLPEVLLHKYTLCALLIVMAVALLLINRQMEVTSRLLFVWKETVEEQKAQVEDMRHKNEALVYNILPPHVAKHFLGAKKKDEELYSLSYDSVGVLFASMPNFSDFYTEETVNNQGIECLRFLNEVISDYDALLEQPAFRDITKIKTIGSTYMAASGLKSENEIPNSDKEKCHLAVLTEFALALRRTLNGINEQSFNNFILRIGINHGPITAGVIGARKPHYDVWGNTVNVASRMESTGKAGSIQVRKNPYSPHVVEETKNILENFGYGFEQRGLVSVKGKGKLMTYYLIGKESKDDKSNIVPNSLST
ncbi:Adenylate cyclase type 3 [Nymphon striatum]|nr:Adenylate cyclase type 3 [Nymphon striatum]